MPLTPSARMFVLRLSLGLARTWPSPPHLGSRGVTTCSHSWAFPNSKARTVSSVGRTAERYRHLPSSTYPLSTASSTSRSSHQSDGSSNASQPSTYASGSQSSSTSTATLISRESLHKLHNLSALNPPPEGSQEESILLSELSSLISLMDRVKDVELPSSFEERAELLAKGVGEVVLSQDSIDRVDALRAKALEEVGGKSDRGAEAGPGTLTDETEKKGKELLGWATNRVGDYYASRVKAK